MRGAVVSRMLKLVAFFGHMFRMKCFRSKTQILYNTILGSKAVHTLVVANWTFCHLSHQQLAAVANV